MSKQHNFGLSEATAYIVQALPPSYFDKSTTNKDREEITDILTDAYVEIASKLGGKWSFKPEDQES